MWVESRASVPFGEQDTKHQARAQAIADARRTAMEQVLGVRLDHRFLDFQQEQSLRGEYSLTETLLRASHQGRQVQEEVIFSELTDDVGCTACRYTAQIRTCIAPERDEHDRNFRVHLSLNRSNYVDGDEAIMTVTTSRDAYIYLYNVDLDSNAVLLFPNDYSQDNFIRAGMPWSYPSHRLRDRGIHAVARLPAGTHVSAELIRVVASKTPLPPSLQSGVNENGPSSHSPSATPTISFLSLIRRLLYSELEWTDDAAAFLVRQH